MSRSLIAAVVLIFALAAQLVSQANLPKNGVVPDEATAVAVAEVFFQHVFSRETIAKFQPYHAQLEEGVWTVYGTLKQGSRGGTPMLRIKKQDGQVLEIWHSR
jgi:hypothetical protein